MAAERTVHTRGAGPLETLCGAAIASALECVPLLERVTCQTCLDALGATREEISLCRRALMGEAGSACLVDARGILQWVNPRWDRFARRNGGAPAALGRVVAGTPWLSHIRGEEARAHFRRLFEAALDGSSWPGVVELGECNSAEELRLVTTRLERWMAPGRQRPLGVVVSCQVMSSRVAREGRTISRAAPSSFGGAGGPVVQCWCCRSVRDPEGEEAWHFVPALVARVPDEVTFRLCPRCSELFGGASLAALG